MPRPYSLRSLVSLLVLALALLTPLEGRAQEDAGGKALQEAFAAGKARAVLESAARRVEIGIFDESAQYSRSQAIYVLKKFFEKHPPRRFAWQSISKSSEQNRFLAGNYWQKAEEQALRVHVRLRNSDEAGWQLQEVRIERP